MRLGINYYPEHWPRERWAHDARRLRELGIDVVRMAEFAWSRMEPAQGRFTWEWLDEALAVFEAEAFSVVLGTPTAAPPLWLSEADPETLPVDAQGRRRRPGGRRHYCPTHPAYREHTRRIVTAMADRYGARPSVIGWQIDNEFGGGSTAACYCASCEAHFRDWLRERHGTLAALNAAWGTVFWSAELDSWEQIRLPVLHLATPNPSLVLDHERFASAAMVAYQQLQVDLLRERIGPDRFITHNFMGLYPDLDAHALAAPLDLATWDSYPIGNLGRWKAAMYGGEEPDAPWAYDVGDPAVTGFAHDLTYGLREQPFWVMEQGAGHVNWSVDNTVVRPEAVRLWTWHAVAAGADAVVYFRERAPLMGQEQYHSGLWRQDDSPDVGHAAVTRLRGELDDLRTLTARPPRHEVALVFRFDDLWALRLQPHHPHFTYLKALFAWYRALLRLGIPVAVVGPEARLDDYRAVLAPALHVIDDGLTARLVDYADGGGTLLLGARTGVKTASNLWTDQPLPGPFRAPAGVRVAAWGALSPGLGWPLESDLPGLGGPAGTWIESLEPEGAEVLAAHAGGPYAGTAALTVHRAGAGRVYYCGWLPDGPQALAILRHVAAEAGLERLAALPPGLVACRRGDRVALLNFTEAPLAAEVGGRTLTVGALDVAIV